jgi:hypothetical protein
MRPALPINAAVYLAGLAVVALGFRLALKQ